MDVPMSQTIKTSIVGNVKIMMCSVYFVGMWRHPWTVL
jgi:hypothetical protein